jgi:hypothetical protein
MREGDQEKSRPPHPRRKRGCPQPYPLPKAVGAVVTGIPPGRGAASVTALERSGKGNLGVSSTEGAGRRGFKCAVDVTGHRLPTEA